MFNASNVTKIAFASACIFLLYKQKEYQTTHLRNFRNNPITISYKIKNRADRDHVHDIDHQVVSRSLINKKHNSKNKRETITIRLHGIERKHALLIDEIAFKHRNFLKEWLSWAEEVADPNLKDYEPDYEYMDQSISEREQNVAYEFVIEHIPNPNSILMYNERKHDLLIQDNNNKGEICGMIGFNWIDWNKKVAYLGYWLIPTYNGKGIITHCVKTICSIVWYKLNLDHIEITAAKGNSKSIAVAKRLGFKKINTDITKDFEIIDGVKHDLQTFVLSRTDRKTKYSTDMCLYQGFYSQKLPQMQEKWLL